MRCVVPTCIILTQILLFPQRSVAESEDDYLRVEMKKHQIPGLALAIVHNHQIVKEAAYGLANLEWQVPVRLDTVFEIGSLTKQFTAAGILLLVQDDRLALEDRISHYLKPTPDAWKDITLRHLLTHTSGIWSYTGLDGFELRRHLTQAQFLEAIGRQPLEFQPGQSWKYCNTGYNLLGYIIENVSGKTYWEFMSQRIFSPLNMASTTNRLPALVLRNRAAGYEQTNHILVNRDYDLTDIFSAGALVSTVEDLLKWNSELDSGHLLSNRSKEQMWTSARLSSGERTHYGFGWRIGELDGHKNVGHGGATSGFSATLQRFPEDDLAIIILTNTDEQIATTLAKRIAQIYLNPRQN